MSFQAARPPLNESRRLSTLTALNVLDAASYARLRTVRSSSTPPVSAVTPFVFGREHHLRFSVEHSEASRLFASVPTLRDTTQKGAGRQRRERDEPTGMTP